MRSPPGLKLFAQEVNREEKILLDVTSSKKDANG